MKCGLYARISVEERGQKKYSIEAQMARLEEYAKEHKYKIYNRYVDDGISAATITKRKAFMDMISDLDKIDIILFTQLDRFSRNVLDANMLVKQFSDNNVAFKAIDDDDIDTTTADGKFMFDIKVSLAERERKKTSERIKTVNQFKLQQKKAVFGVGPRGYKLNNEKKWVLSEDAPMIFDMGKTYIESQSRQAVRDMLLTKYGIEMDPATISHYLRKKEYTGCYKNVENYYPVIWTEEMFEEMTRLRTRIKVRNRDSENVYVFRGLLKCKYCGRIMTGARKPGKDKPLGRIIYRCDRKSLNSPSKIYCTEMHQIREEVVENYLIENVEKQIKDYMIEVEKEQGQEIINKNSSEKIIYKLNRLKDLYLNDVIQMEAYQKEYKSLMNQLNSIEDKNKKKSNIDLTPFKDILNGFLNKRYKSLTRLEKRYFWCQIIDYIEVDKAKNMKIYFKH